MDKLEKYMRDNAPRWDDKKAPDSVWNKIESELDQPKRIRKNFGRTIGILAIITIAAIALYFAIGQADNMSLKNENNDQLLYAELESFNETEQYYLSAIYVNQQELNEQISDKSIDDDLAELDRIDQELRAEYKAAQGIYKEEILRALIRNHQTKLNILQDILLQISQLDKPQQYVL